ncbi:ABC transporter permease [Rossellomorea sp. BNER]|uniref:ABC transporter permease n=1 Tax=Rossellomorea sp. BNER TaxID=2962031 RepID=UPI003AF316AE|nr:ABC transporter permease [Rossellomorea sp. BNER]
MNNFWLMLSHSYFSKLKTKSFILTTVIVVAAIFLLVNFENVVTNFTGEDEPPKVAVLDEGNLYKPFSTQLAQLNDEIQVEKVTLNEKALEKAVKDGEYEGYLILSQDHNDLPQGVYKSVSISNSEVWTELFNSLQAVKNKQAATQLNLSNEELQSLNTPPTFEREALVEGAKSEKELSEARGIVYVLLFFIYFSVIVYANMTAMEVATEKSSRVMEILISSVSPVKQMFAKILGIGLVGLTQMAVLLAAGYFAISQNKEELVGGFFEGLGFADTSISLIIYAGIFFLLGFFLYATLAALLGSLVSRIEDVQQMIMPMTFLVMIGFFIAMFGLGNPESTFVTITSYIPFFTPMVMFLRVGMLNIAAWEPILGMGVLLLSILVLGWFGARVYRGGVLMYGKSNSFKDIKKAIELTKNK